VFPETAQLHVQLGADDLVLHQLKRVSQENRIWIAKGPAGQASTFVNNRIRGFFVVQAIQRTAANGCRLLRFNAERLGAAFTRWESSP
jgi:hypothetical protein